jgi:hypothetical protein
VPRQYGVILQILFVNTKEMALNNTQINAIKPRDKPYKVADEHSRYLYVNIVKNSDSNKKRKKACCQ